MGKHAGGRRFSVRSRNADRTGILAHNAAQNLRTLVDRHFFCPGRRQIGRGFRDGGIFDDHGSAVDIFRTVPDGNGNSGGDQFFGIFNDEDGKKSVVIFQAPNKAVSIIRFYNSSATKLS